MKDNKNLNKLDVSNFWNFNFINYLLFFIGIIFIAAGYIIMYLGEVNSTQTLVTSPRLLIIGYCIFIPIAIIYKPKKIRGGSSTG